MKAKISTKTLIRNKEEIETRELITIKYIDLSNNKIRILIHESYEGDLEIHLVEPFTNFLTVLPISSNRIKIKASPLMPMEKKNG